MIVDGLSLAQRNPAADVAVTETMETEEFDSLDDIGWRIAKIEAHANCVILRLERLSGINSGIGN